MSKTKKNKKLNRTRKLRRINSRSILDVSSTRGMLFEVRDELKAEIRALGGKMSSFESRMDSLESRMGSFESRMDSLESRMGSFESRMDSLECRMDSLECRIDSLARRMDGFEQKLDSKFEEMKALFHQALLRFEEQRADNKIVLEGLQLLNGRQDRLEVELNEVKTTVLELAKIKISSLPVSSQK